MPKETLQEKEVNALKLWELVSTTHKLIEEYFHYRTEIIEVVEQQAKAYGENIFYVRLTYCSRKGCQTCPHGFEFVTRRETKTGKTFSTSHGKSISRAILRNYGRENAYKHLKAIETRLKELFEKRNKIAERIKIIKYAFKGYE